MQRPMFASCCLAAIVLGEWLGVAAGASYAVASEPVGISLQSDDDGVYVTKVVPDSPATRCASSLVGEAGLLSIRQGDEILSIDGIYVVSHDEAAARIRGGSDVVQAVIRQRNSGNVRSVNICRNGARVRAERHLSAHDRIVWVLLAADTLDKNIGTGCMASLARMEHLLLGSGIPLNRLVVFHQYDTNFSTTRLKNGIRQIGSLVRPNDTFVVFVNGHGAVDPTIVAKAQEYAERHGEPLRRNPFFYGAHFNMRDGDLLREQAWMLLLQQPGRLKLFITDTCLSVGLARLAESQQKPSIRNDETAENESEAFVCRVLEGNGVSKLEALLLHAVGTVDFASCGFGQTSLTIAPRLDDLRKMSWAQWNEYLAQGGAIFTSSLCDVLIREPAYGKAGYGFQEWFDEASAITIRRTSRKKVPGQQSDAHVPMMGDGSRWRGDGTLPPTREWVYYDGLQDGTAP